MLKDGKVSVKNLKVSVAAAASVAAVASVAAKDDKCKVCDKIVENEDFGLECEICESWFRI